MRTAQVMAVVLAPVAAATAVAAPPGTRWRGSAAPDAIRRPSSANPGELLGDLLRCERAVGRLEHGENRDAEDVDPLMSLTGHKAVATLHRYGHTSAEAQRASQERVGTWRARQPAVAPKIVRLEEAAGRGGR